MLRDDFFPVIWIIRDLVSVEIPLQQMFVSLGPGSFLVFGDVMCVLAAGVFGALWYVGKQTPKHIGKQRYNCCVLSRDA
jgi:hypothetical protein